MGIDKMVNKVVNGMVIFVLLNAVISFIWYIIELLTIGEIQESGDDTWICLGLSLILTIIINSEIVTQWLKAK